MHLVLARIPCSAATAKSGMPAACAVCILRGEYFEQIRRDAVGRAGAQSNARHRPRGCTVVSRQYMQFKHEMRMSGLWRVAWLTVLGLGDMRAFVDAAASILASCAATSSCLCMVQRGLPSMKVRWHGGCAGSGVLVSNGASAGTHRLVGKGNSSAF